MLQGALHGRDKALHCLQDLRGRVDGGVLGHDVTVIVPERPNRPLTERKVPLAWKIKYSKKQYITLVVDSSQTLRPVFNISSAVDTLCLRSFYTVTLKMSCKPFFTTIYLFLALSQT